MSDERNALRWFGERENECWLAKQRHVGRVNLLRLKSKVSEILKNRGIEVLKIAGNTWCDMNEVQARILVAKKIMKKHCENTWCKLLLAMFPFLI